MIKICEFCGKEFEAKRKDKSFCSRICQGKKWRLKKKDKIKEYKKEYLLKNKDKIKEYYLKNKDKIIKQRSIIHSTRYKNDILYRLSSLHRGRLRSALKAKNISKKMSSLKYLGCSPAYLKKHLEQQFQKGMTWDNQGEWHIDHHIPLASAENEDQLNKLFHYGNLKPMWATDNISKSSSLPEQYNLTLFS